MRNCPLACTGSAFAVYDCAVPADRAWCSDLFVNLLPMLASPKFNSPYKRTWERLLAKAAFEERAEMIKLGTSFLGGTHVKKAGWVTRHEPIMELSIIWVSCSLQCNCSHCVLLMKLSQP